MAPTRDTLPQNPSLGIYSRDYNRVMTQPPQFGPCPPRFSDLKKEIADSYTDFEAGVTKAWGEILTELNKATKDIASQGSQVWDHTALASRAHIFRDFSRGSRRSTSASSMP